MIISELLELWRKTPAIASNIAAWRTLPPRPAQTVPLPHNLHPVLAQTLRVQGIPQLFSHQAASWQHIQANRHPVVVTGTASGKTLCYNLPVLHHLFGHPGARALYLFPTKALAYDQADTLRAFTASLARISAADQAGADLQPPHFPIVAATYDGDTPTSSRAAIRREARIILTNPDMLHTAILPHHTKWAGFFRHLRFVVVDELHSYRGVFGSHVANMLRRLKRVAQFYGAILQFILTSATIANPTELAERLIEMPTVLVDNDGSAKGPKHFLIYNPPIVNHDLGLRRSSLQETVRLSRDLLQHNFQTIIFGRTRRTVELLLTYLREGVSSTPQTSQPSIRAYRSGYLPRQRREIEQGLREGNVRAVVATSALELGLDIGQMSAAILVGYPGAIASTWQQAGRAGRQDNPAVAVLVASASPIDQFLVHHPDYFFDRTPEHALIDPDNLLILLQHLRCAAFELPFHAGDNFGRIEADAVEEFLHFLHQNGDLHRSRRTYYWMADRYPAQQVSLRSASPETVKLLVSDDEDHGTVVGEVDLASAAWMVHPGAIYLHEGQSYQTEILDLEQHTAYLRPISADYYTEPVRETSAQLTKLADRALVKGAVKSYGEILVTTQTVGYHTVRWYTAERLATHEVELPPHDLHTTGYWFTLNPETVQSLREQGLWTNDPNDYGPNWAVQRTKARSRDGYRCQMCETPERGRQHDVHHKRPFRQFDSYQAANRLSNLVTLCRSCHRRVETAVRMRSGLSGLAAALGQLAPLFLMCDSHDFGIHADPRSPLAEGEPVVLIYDTAPAGLGFSQRLFHLHADLVSHTHELVARCSCAGGCPSCVGPAGEDGAGGKRETLAILKLLKP